MFINRGKRNQDQMKDEKRKITSYGTMQLKGNQIILIHNQRNEK